MAEKVAKVGVKKESGYLYFVDKHGDVSRAKMARGRKGSKKNKPQKVAKVLAIYTLLTKGETSLAQKWLVVADEKERSQPRKKPKRRKLHVEK